MIESRLNYIKFVAISLQRIDYINECSIAYFVRSEFVLKFNLVIILALYVLIVVVLKFNMVEILETDLPNANNLNTSNSLLESVS